MDSISELREAAASTLLRWRDTAVVGAAATLLTTEATTESIALLCRALALENDPEIREEVLWVLSPLWKSGQLDLPPLLSAVYETYSGPERQGAAEAAEWLGVSLER